MKLLTFYILLVLPLTFANANANAKEKEKEKEKENVLTLVTVKDVAATSEIYHKVLLAYKNIGYSLELIRMPSKRAFWEANHNSIIDADLVRANEAESVLIDYIKIPIPVYYTEIKAYAKKSNLNINNWDSLAHYEVVTVRGLLATNTVLSNKNIPFITVASPKQALNMVKMGRADVAVIIAATLENDQNLEEVYRDFPYTKIIDKKHFFHFVHKRHKAMIPELTAEFTHIFSDVITLTE